MKLKETLAVLIVFLACVPAIFADDAQELFKTKCGKCHQISVGDAKIGKGKGGPNLTGYAQKRSADFLKLYSTDPAAAQAKFADIYEKEIKGKYKVKMKKIDLSDAEIEVIVGLMK